MNPSTTRGRTLSDVAQHRPQCTAVAHCSKSSEQSRRVRPRLLLTAYVERTAVLRPSTLGTLEQCVSGHYGTIGQPRRPVACSGRSHASGRRAKGPLRDTSALLEKGHTQEQTWPDERSIIRQERLDGGRVAAPAAGRSVWSTGNTEGDAQRSGVPVRRLSDDRREKAKHRVGVRVTPAR